MVIHRTTHQAMPLGHDWLIISLPSGVRHVYVVDDAALTRAQASIANTLSPAVSASA